MPQLAHCAADCTGYTSATQGTVTHLQAADTTLPLYLCLSLSLSLFFFLFFFSSLLYSTLSLLYSLSLSPFFFYRLRALPYPKKRSAVPPRATVMVGTHKARIASGYQAQYAMPLLQAITPHLNQELDTSFGWASSAKNLLCDLFLVFDPGFGIYNFTLAIDLALFLSFFRSGCGMTNEVIPGSCPAQQEFTPL